MPSWNPTPLCQCMDTQRATVLCLESVGETVEHLPDMWMIGCLYNIGCQIDQALCKWDFFPLEWNSCLVWGVSIFHAYGHQWACQLWYHPWKDECWGLSDGEVCEQFWSGLCHLVPGLHIVGKIIICHMIHLWSPVPGPECILITILNLAFISLCKTQK